MSTRVAPAADAAPSEAVGDVPDTDRLYRSEASVLQRFFRRRLNSADVTDHVQETFLRFAASGTRPVRPGAFLNRIARNLAHDVSRRSAVRTDYVPIDAIDLPGPDPVHYLETRDMLARVEAAIAQLKPRTRAIFLAHRVDGQSYAEIAAATGITVKGVEKQMGKAIAAIDRLTSRTGR